MPGLGTIINTAAIIAGGLLGLLFGKLMNEKIKDSLCKACGVCVLFIGMAGAFEKMLSSSETIKNYVEKKKKVDELVGATLFLLSEEAAGFITGVVLPIDGGFSAYSGV